METITLTHNSHTDRAEPLHDAADEENLLTFFDQYSNFMSPNSDWLSSEDFIIINEVSLEGFSTT